jgi:hypothetical protein
MSNTLVIGSTAGQDQDLRFLHRRTATGRTLSVVGGSSSIIRASWLIESDGTFVETPVPLGSKKTFHVTCHSNVLTLDSTSYDRAPPGVSSAILSSWNDESWTAVSYSP